MRILQIIPSISLVYGGPSQMVLGLSAALASQGVDVTIITTDSNGDIGQPPLDVPLNLPIEQNGYHIIYFRCSPFRRYKFSLGLLRWLHQNAGQFDLAHIHALFSPVTTLAATIARYHKLPYIIRPCGMLDRADLQKKKYLKQVYAALLERHNLAGAAAIHFTSKREAEVSERFGLEVELDIRQGFKPLPHSESPLKRTEEIKELISPLNKIFIIKGGINYLSTFWTSKISMPRDLVIPLGVNLEVDRSCILRVNTTDKERTEVLTANLERTEVLTANLEKSGIPTILFMSRIDPKKGVDLLIAALESILLEQIEFNFILAGSNAQDAEYETKIKLKIQNSILAKHTTITGFASGDLKVELLAKADLFVLPSYYENFGIAVAEAMAAGTPVAISDRVYISEEIEQAEAGWVGPLEVGAIARLIRSALLDPQERKRRGINAKNYAEKHYNWRAIGERTIEAYQQILSDKVTN
ncbi:MAG: glycosyltransferase [Microcoleus sp.]